MLEPNKSCSSVIQDSLDAYEMDKRTLADLSGMSYTNVCRLLKGEIVLTIETALKIEAVLGIDAEYLLMLDNNERINAERSKMRKEIESIATKCAVGEFGPVYNSDDYQIRTLTGMKRKRYLERIERPQTDEEKTLVSNINHKHIGVFALLASYEMSKYDIPLYNEDALREISDSLFRYLENSDGVNMFIHDLFQAGVFFYISHRAKGLAIHSSMCWSDPKARFENRGIGNPMIIYFNEDNRIDHFYASVLHQIFHILNPTSMVYTSCVMDSSGSTTSEKYADQFVHEAIRGGKIEDVYNAQKPDNKVKRTVDALQRTIPEIAVYAYLRWFKPHYRYRNLGNLPTLAERYDKDILLEFQKKEK